MMAISDRIWEASNRTDEWRTSWSLDIPVGPKMVDDNAGGRLLLIGSGVGIRHGISQERLHYAEIHSRQHHGAVQTVVALGRGTMDEAGVAQTSTLFLAAAGVCH